MKNILLIVLILNQSYMFSQTWFEVESGTTKKLNTINFPSDEVGYIGGNDSLILKTTDGGQTWNAIDYAGVNFIESGTADNILNLKFVNELIGFMTVGPYSHGVYKTTDGGLNWTVIPQSEEFLCYHYGLYLFDENNGYLGGSGCFTAGHIQHIGETELTPRPLLDQPLVSAMIVDIDFLDGNFGIAVGGHSMTGYIFRTIDGGLTWNTIETGLEDSVERLTSIAIINDTLAYIGYNPTEESYGLLVTHDAGLTWEYDTETTTFYYPKFHALHLSNNGNIYTAGKVAWDNTGVIFEKKTDSDWWNTEAVEHSINGLSSYADSIVWGVGDSGHIVVNHNPETLALNEVNQTVQHSLSVFPNPAIETINLGLSEGDQAKIDRIKIHTLLGEIVYQTTLTKTAIDIKNLTKGTYIISIILKDGHQTHAKFTKQ